MLKQSGINSNFSHWNTLYYFGVISAGHENVRLPHPGPNMCQLMM